MMGADEKLASLGFGRTRSEPACWRVSRLEPTISPAPVPASCDSRFGPEPAHSRTLMRWRKLLARGSRRPSPYRISRAGS